MKIDWISVKDRLPESNKDVMVYWPDGGKYGFPAGVGIAIMYKLGKYPNWSAPSFISGYEYEADFGQITHWAEVPEGPK